MLPMFVIVRPTGRFITAKKIVSISAVSMVTAVWIRQPMKELYANARRGGGRPRKRRPVDAVFSRLVIRSLKPKPAAVIATLTVPKI